ncbi:MAG: hypothetical protein NT000_06430, partial [Proteobacteria bacterium]|nr:hypothetical protein [Pseudomonadota bacterium]
ILEVIIVTRLRPQIKGNDHKGLYDHLRGTPLIKKNHRRGIPSVVQYTGTSLWVPMTKELRPQFP